MAALYWSAMTVTSIGYGEMLPGACDSASTRGTAFVPQPSTAHAARSDAARSDAARSDAARSDAARPNAAFDWARTVRCCQ